MSISRHWPDVDRDANPNAVGRDHAEQCFAGGDGFARRRIEALQHAGDRRLDVAARQFAGLFVELDSGQELVSCLGRRQGLLGEFQIRFRFVDAALLPALFFSSWTARS